MSKWRLAWKEIYPGSGYFWVAYFPAGGIYSWDKRRSKVLWYICREIKAWDAFNAEKRKIGEYQSSEA